MKQLSKRLLSVCLMVALLGTLVLQAAPIAQAADYLTSLPQKHYGEYGTVNIVHDQGNCYSMQGVAVDANYTYCAKIGSNDAVAMIVRLAKSDGSKTIMTNASNGSSYFYNLGHANALDIVKINGVQQMFVTGGANLVRLTMNGTKLTTAGTYTFTYNGAATNTTAVQIMYASDKEVKVITKGGKSLYTGTLNPTASSGVIDLKHLCNLDVANIRLKGELHDYSTFTQQGFDYKDGKVFLPLSGNAYVETINESIVAVYDIEGASGTVRNDPTLSFRVISGQYAGLFEIEDVEVCDHDGKLYFSTNRRKTETDTNYDGVSFFNGYVYDPSMSTTGPDDYRWETVNNQWVSVMNGGNTWNNPIRAYGSISDNTMTASVYHMSRGVVLEHNKPWVVEWKSSGSFAGGGMLLHGGKTSTTVDAPYIFRFQNSTFISMGYYDGKQHNNYGIKLSDHGIDGIAEHVYRLTNKIASDGSNMVYLSIDGKELGALNNYYIGLSDQNKQVNWVNGKDFTFCYQGTIDNPLNQCKLDYLQVWANGTPAEPNNRYRWESKNDNLTSLSGTGYTENIPTIYNGSVSGTTYTSACFRLNKAVRLMHDQAWSVEWQSEGTTTSVFLLSAGEGGKNVGAPYLFRYGANLFFLGASDGTQHANYGIDISKHGIDGTAKHTYRLTNKLNSNGSNMVYFYVDGQELGPMNNYYGGVTDKNTTSDWVNGKDFVFDYVGNRSYAMGGTYHYLQVLEGECDHSYTSKITTAAGCESAGVKTYTCSNCGDQYTEPVAATGHSYTSKVTKPTCTAKGYTTYTCKNCSHSYTSNEVAATGHSYKTVTVDATCTTDGSITKTCSGCGDQQIQVIPSTGHNYSSTVIKPTCTEKGYTLYQCACGHSYKANETAALGHSYKATIVDATCTAEGTITKTCSTCGDIQREITPALGHSYSSQVIKPTCTESGYTRYTCTYCSQSYVDQLTNPTGHSHTGKVTAPTCTSNGYTTYTCHCGDIYTANEVAALGHNYQAVITTAPGCESAGVKTFTCKTCGNSYTEPLAATGHKYTSKVTAPTCTAKGYTTYTCPCGHSYKADEVAALGHSYKTVTVNATCTEDGSITDTCTTCGDTKVQVIPATGHSYKTVTIQPTCTSNGYTRKYCSCGESYVTERFEALGHSYKTVTVNATCTVDGSITNTCTTCGNVQAETIPATGHSYEAVVTAPTCTEAGYTTYTCHCGDTYTADEVAALGHTYETVTVDATCTVDGSITNTCHCGDTQVEVIPATGHSFVSGICGACGEVDPDYVKPVVQPTLKLKAPALEFKDMIKVIAFFTAENIDDVAEMGMLTYTEQVETVDITTANHVIPGAEYDAGTGRYYSSSQGIHAKYLGDDVYLAIYAKLSDGSYVYTRLVSYSPITYASNQLKNSNDMNLKQLVAAMLNYGAAAQNYFGYKTDALANATLTEEQINLPEAYRADMVNTVASPSKDKQGIFANNKGFGTRRPAVSFEGAFSINYFFTPNYTPVDGITMYYWTEAAFNAVDVLTVENASGSVQMSGEGVGQYRGDIEGIAAKSLSEAVYVAAVYSDGTTSWTSGVLGYSIGAYCSSQATKGGTMADLAMATAVYGYHAKAFFG